jgi:hypothetical protein
MKWGTVQIHIGTRTAKLAVWLLYRTSCFVLHVYQDNEYMLKDGVVSAKAMCLWIQNCL